MKLEGICEATTTGLFGVVLRCDLVESHTGQHEMANDSGNSVVWQLSSDRQHDHCATCRHWTKSDDDWDDMIRPVDPDTYETMESHFEVRLCKHPKLLFCERPLESDGFAVADGSNYKANLYTAENFGCVRHQPSEVAAAREP